MKLNQKETFCIWVDSFLGLEYKHKKHLYDGFHGQKIIDYLQAEKDYLVNGAGENAFNTIKQSCNNDYIAFLIAELEKRNITPVTLSSEDYPNELKEIPCPPLVLYTSGNVKLLKSEKITIVGSRKTLPFALAFAEDMANTLSKSGLTVVTGIAEGADEKIISGAIKNGKVISVLAGGFDNVYPRKNVGLAEQVKKNGLLISEYPYGTKTERYHYFARNRILGGLSKATLVVSGGVKSGTSITAGYADDYSRQVFALPYSVNIPSGAGCNAIIKNGGMLVDCPEDILCFYGLENKKESLPDLTDDELKVYHSLFDGDVGFDKLCEKTGLPVTKLITLLTMLEMKKVIVKNAGNVYSLVK